MSVFSRQDLEMNSSIIELRRRDRQIARARMGEMSFTPRHGPPAYDTLENSPRHDLPAYDSLEDEDDETSV